MNHQNRLTVYHSLVNLIVIAALLAANLAVNLAMPQSVRAEGPLGSALVWGWTGYGPTSATQISSTPVQVTEFNGVVAIDGSRSHTLMVKSDGTVWAFGNNTYWQLGDGTTNSSTIPVQVVGPGGVGYLSGITAVATGWYHNLALKSDGTVWAWGYNSDGQLGIAVRDSGSSTPVQVKAPAGAGFLTDVVAVAAERFWSLALKSDGTVWAWGANYEAGVGDNTTGTRSRPVQVKGTGGVGFLTDVTTIAAGDTLAIARKTDGSVWTWGSNYYGQAGDGTMATSGANSRKLAPVQVKGPGGVGFLGDVVAVGTGQFHALAAKSDGTVWTWGDDTAGQLGNGTNPASTTPVQVLGPNGTGFLTGITAVSGANAVQYREYAHSVALAQDGSVWTWGWNNYGQLGDGTLTLRTTPVKVVGTGGVGYLGGATMAIASHNATLAVAPAPAIPAIKVVKSSTTTAITAANQVVPYTFSVTNIGNVTLTGITVSDPNCTAAISGPTGDTNTNSQLDLTETWTYTCNHTVTQAELDTGGKLSNTVTADSTESASATATLDIPITQSPAISLTKSANPTTYNAVNQSITYSYVIKNTGNVTLSGPFAVTDDKATVTCTQPADAALSPNEEMTCTASYSIVPGDITAGTVTNTAYAKSGETQSLPDSETVTFVNIPPDLSVTKTANPTSVPETGGSVTFTFAVINNAAEAATITSLSDSKFGTLTGDTDCQVGATLAANGGSCSFTATFPVPASDLLGSHTNTFTAVATDPEGFADTATADAMVTYTNVPPTVTLDKSVDVEFLDEPGGDFTFMLTIHNTSWEEVTITALTDSQSADAVDFAACTALIGTSLAAGASTSCSYVVSHTDVGGWENTAEVVVTDNDGTTGTATDTQFVSVFDVRPTVTLEKLVDITTLPEPGGAFHFTLRITNTSVEPITIWQLVDTNLPTYSFDEYLGTSLQPNQVLEIPYTVSHTDAMTYDNWAEVTVEDNEGTPVSARAEQSVEVTDVPPTVTLVKSVDVATMPEPGGVFNFTLTIKNTSVEPVEITDLTDSQYPPASGYVTQWLDPGEVLTIEYPITHTDPGAYPNDSVGHGDGQRAK